MKPLVSEKYTISGKEYIFLVYSVGNYFVYVRKNPDGKLWGSCQCDGWWYRKNCKHLKQVIESLS